MSYKLSVLYHICKLGDLNTERIFKKALDEKNYEWLNRYLFSPYGKIKQQNILLLSNWISRKIYLDIK